MPDNTKKEIRMLKNVVEGLILALVKTIEQLDDISQKPDPSKAFVEELEFRVQKLKETQLLGASEHEWILTYVASLRAHLQIQ